MFSISFNSGLYSAKRSSSGTLVLGSETETFLASFDHWQPEDYERQWQEAISLVVNEGSKSALITEMPAPSVANFIRWWPMWRFGESVKLNEQLLFMADLETPIDAENPYTHVGEYRELNEEGERISEWVVPLQDLVDFLRSSSEMI